jgi:ketosteroid isomerase-like protein
MISRKNHGRQAAVSSTTAVAAQIFINSGEKTMATTKEIIDHHLNAFFSYDVPGVLSDYGKDIVFFTASGPLKGVNAIRPMFEKLITEFKQPGSSFNMKQYFV